MSIKLFVKLFSSVSKFVLETDLGLSVCLKGTDNRDGFLIMFIICSSPGPSAVLTVGAGRVFILLILGSFLDTPEEESIEDKLAVELNPEGRREIGCSLELGAGTGTGAGSTSFLFLGSLRFNSGKVGFDPTEREGSGNGSGAEDGRGRESIPGVGWGVKDLLAIGTGVGNRCKVCFEESTFFRRGSLLFRTLGSAPGFFLGSRL